LTGTWVTDELKKALEKGYVVQRIYEVWHFDETEQYDPKTKTGGLFTDYVNTFLKMTRKPAVGQSGVRAKTINGGISETTTKRREYSWTTTT
jgi:hypothetical protein